MTWPARPEVFDVYWGPEGTHWVLNDEAALPEQLQPGDRVSIIGGGQFVVTAGGLEPVEHPLPMDPDTGYPRVWQ